MEQRGHLEWNVRKLVENRNKFPEKTAGLNIISAQNVRRTFDKIAVKDYSDESINETVAWLEKVSKYIPISKEEELEEIIKIMIMLSEERARLNYLYDKPGLELMGKLRDCILRYFVVLSELRAYQKEYFVYWHSKDYWYHEWSQVILNLLPTDTMTQYGFSDTLAKDILNLLALELACADSASKLEAPMIRMHFAPEINKNIFIPTEAAANEFNITVSKILKEEQSFAEWVRELKLIICDF